VNNGNGREGPKEGNVMNYHIAEQIARDRLREARQIAAQANLIKDLPRNSEPLRVTVGLGLIRVGRWIAGPAAMRQTARRVAA
jgi:hypothetical protein